MSKYSSLEEQFNGMASILEELQGELFNLSIKLKTMEERLNNLESNKQLELSSVPGKHKAIALSELSTDTELSSNTQVLIDKAVDSIIRYGQKIPYLNR